MHFYNALVEWKRAKISGMDDNIRTLLKGMGYPLKVQWHEIFFLRNMLPMKEFIMVAFVIHLQVWSENFAKIPSLQNIGPWNYGIISQITISLDFHVALNTIAWVYLLLLIS